LSYAKLRQFLGGTFMGQKYLSDVRDVVFNLNEVLDVSKHEEYGFDAASVKEILTEFDKFVGNEIYPTREKSDEEGVTLDSDGVKVSQCLHPVQKSFYENGWYALGLPEDIGGTPVPEALTLACLSLATGANAAWTMYPGLTKSAMNVIRLKGDDYLKSTFIPPMMDGRWGGTMCLTEPGAGSDVGACKTTAAPIDGKENWYSIKGTKIFISSGESDLYENNIHLVLARTPDAPEGTKGISLFIVPRFRVNEDGSNGEANDVRCSKVEHKMGIHASATCEMQFGENGNCEGYLIDEKFNGMATMFIMMNEARLNCGVQGEAQANLAMLMAVDYAKERSQFGTEILNHADVKRLLLKSRAMSRGMRALCLYTADLFDKAKTDNKYEDYIAFLTPICKSFCSEQGFNVAVDAVQVHGGYGYCTEYGVEQFIRDTKIATIYEGTNGIQAIDFVTRKILKDGGKTLNNISNEIFSAVNGKLDEEFGVVKGIFAKAMGAAQEAMGFIGKKAKAGEMNIVFQSCSDFLNVAAHIVVAWRLMESALVAQEKLANAAGDEKEYLESKVVDFRIYCKTYLVQAISQAKTITSLEEDITSFPV
jgi:alkylation response protein AidB-like acyl-CoA dehydrogenase